jgi:ABC-type uncharacterized transport system permease subunit
MHALVSLEFLLGLVAYSLASGLYFVQLTRRGAASSVLRWAPWALGVGALLHAAHVVSASLVTRICPVETLHFALSLSALIAVGAFLWLRRRRPLDALGAFVAPAALCFLVGAQFVGVERPSAGVPRGLLAAHVTANLLGVGLFLLAGATGALYLVQERRLKQKRASSAGLKLPPLDALDRTVHVLLLAGFPLLTVGVVSGNYIGPSFATAPEALRSLLAFGTWGLLAAVLVARAASARRSAPCSAPAACSA